VQTRCRVVAVSTKLLSPASGVDRHRTLHTYRATDDVQRDAERGYSDFVARGRIRGDAKVALQTPTRREHPQVSLPLKRLPADAELEKAALSLDPRIGDFEP
jgi:hypothetical protein